MMYDETDRVMKAVQTCYERQVTHLLDLLSAELRANERLIETNNQLRGEVTKLEKEIQKLETHKFENEQLRAQVVSLTERLAEMERKLQNAQGPKGRRTAASKA